MKLKTPIWSTNLEANLGHPICDPIGGTPICEPTLGAPSVSQCGAIHLGSNVVPHLRNNHGRPILEPILGATSETKSEVPYLGANLGHPIW